MSQRQTIFSFFLAVTAYLLLWLLIPKATFVPNTINLITNTAIHARGLLKYALLLSGVFLASLPVIIFMAAQISVVYTFARFRMNWWQAILAILACLASAFGLLNIVIVRYHFISLLHHYPNFRQLSFIMANYNGFLKMPMTLLIMLAAGGIGYLVSLRVRDKNLLLPVVMFAACIDFWTVNFGPVASVMHNAPEVAQAVSAPIPAAGAGVFAPVSLIGPGDFLFMALVFAVVHRLRMNGKRNLIFVSAMMSLGMLAVVFGLLPFLPALTTLAVGVVAANWRDFKLTREEKISTTIVAVLLAASLPLVWFILRPQIKQPAPGSHSAVSEQADKRSK